MSTGGQALGGFGGAAAGFLLSGGSPTGALYGAQLGMALGGFLDPPKSPTINGPRLTDLTLQTSTYGAVIPRGYGTFAVNGNVFWLENNIYKEVITKKKSGGKGGQSKPATRIPTYFATFALGLCAGPIIGVRRIWIGPDLFYDAGSTDPGTIAASNDAAVGFRVYRGTDTQLPDARIQATIGVANTPAWRGLAYIVFDDLPLAAYGNSLMGAQVRVEVFTAGSSTASHQLGSVGYLDDWHQGHVSWATWGGVFYPIYHYSQYKGKVYATSADGLTWTKRYLPTELRPLHLAAHNNTIVLIGFDDAASVNKSMRTTDGINWTEVSLGTFRYAQKICYNGAVWCVSCYGYVKVSSDNASSWVEYALPIEMSSSFIFTHNSRIIIGMGSGTFGDVKYLTSDNNGVTWTIRTYPFASTQGVVSATSNGTKIIGITSGQKVVSNDGGNTWSTPVDFISGKSSWEAILYGGGLWVIFHSYEGGYVDSNYAISTDGDSWTYYEVTTGTNFSYGAAFTGSKFVCVPINSGWDTIVVTPTVVPATTPLSSIVQSECLQSGLLTAGDIDVTSLTPQVRGYSIGTVGTIRSALEPLQAAWPFDVRQHGYKIQFIMRGGSSVITIPAADLDARSAGTEPGVQITISREMDSQLPNRVTINHIDPDREYNPGAQYAERLVASAASVRVLDLPLVLTSTEAAGKAEVLLYLYWAERREAVFALPQTYLQLEPGDVVTLATLSGNVVLRLTEISYTGDGRLECRGRFAHAAIYTPTAVGAISAVTGKTTIVPVGGSVYQLLDVPQISSAQSGPSFLAAMTGELVGWKGGVLMQSTDAGATWAQLQTFDAPGTTIGTASNSLGSVDSRVIDNGSLLNVTLTQGELYSITQLAMFGGQNHFAYGVDGRWEIIAARTCTLVSGTSYVLRDLLRGRFGTEWAMSLHAAGDTIVLLDTTDVALIAMGVGTIGLSYLYRGITVDRDISTDSNRAFAYLGVNLKPLSPIALTGAIDPSSNDWSLTWIRRTREGGEWRDHVDASLGETSQAYQIDVFADGTYATVKRTIATTTQDAAYSSADQVTDFGSNQTTLYLKIYQLSATVGRGYPLTQSISR